MAQLGYGNTGPKVAYTDKNAEIQRTMQVLQDRTKAGMENSAQLSHYKNLTGQDYKAPTPAFDKDAYLKQQQDQVNNIFNNQKQSQMAQFNAERDKAMGLVNQQKAKVAPQYAGMRNQSDVVNAQNVSKLREMMAANGISASGENVTANVGLQSARQGALSQLNLQEQETNNDFDRQITDINNPERLNAMLMQIEAERSRALSDANNRADDVGYSRSRDSIMDGRYADETAYGRGQDSKQWDYQTGRDAVGDSRYTNEWNYGVGRDAIGDKRYADETQYNRGIDTRDWNYMLKRDGISDSRYNAKNSGGGGGGSYGSSSYGGSAYAPQTKLPSNPSPARIMTERQYIDAYEQSDARKAGTARVLPGSTDYAKKMQKVLSDLYK